MPRLDKRFRLGFELQVKIHMGSSVIQARVRDISAEGLFLEVSSPLQLGEAFPATLMLQPLLHVICKVRRIEPNQGIGVQLTLTGPVDRKRFANLLHFANLLEEVIRAR
jgi:hypothetical protein